MIIIGDNYLNDEKAEELIHKGLESPDLDYKECFDNSTGCWMEIAKDVYGMANYGGGYIVLGVKDGTFEPIGLDETFHIDTEVWANKFSKWASEKVNLTYFEYKTKINGEIRKFPILYIHGSVSSLVIPKADGTYATQFGQTKTAFNRDKIYTRQNTSTIPATGNEFWKLFWALLKRTAEKTGSEGTPLNVISVLNRKAKPDVIEETLWFNLFPVVELPDFIYVADTKYRYAEEIFTDIDKKSQTSGVNYAMIPSFRLVEKKIYSFSPFREDNPLTFCAISVNKPIPTKEWLADEAKQQNFVMLLNQNLKDLCRRKRFYHDRKRDRYFMKYSGGIFPEITWKPYKSTSTRSLIGAKVNNDGKLRHYEHFGGRLRFVILGNGVYLLIEPIRVLTIDGENPLDQKSNVRISTRKNVFYHNNNYLYDVKLWLHILAGNRQEIHLGDNTGKIIVSISSLNAKVNFGILDDQHTGGDFLDSLKSEPLDYKIEYADIDEHNPLTETSLEE